MKRDFLLEEVTLEEFNCLCEQIGEPIRSNGKKKRLFETSDVLEYDSIFQLVVATQNYEQQQQCIWFPGHISPGEGQERTLSDYFAYVRELQELESQYDKFIVRLTSDISVNHRRSDVFRFQKENGLWRLATFDITARHFDLYDFQGDWEPLNKNRTQVILGIYVPNQELRAA